MDAASAATANQVSTGAEAPSNSLAVLEFVGRLGRELSTGTLSLPSFPDAVMQIRQVLNDRNATTARVAQAVQGEPVFTAKLYRMANSVMMRRGGDPVSDLKGVINRLGFDTVKNLAVALATRQIMNSKKYKALHDDLKALWEHSVDTAAIAYVLADQCESVSCDEALLAGLIHDIGVFYIYSQMSDHAELFEDRDVVAAILDDWHTGIAHAILEDWEFPPAVVEAVDEHETLDRTHVGRGDLTDVIAAANLLSRHGTPAEKKVDLADVPALQNLGLTPESVFELLERAGEDLASIRNALV